ncbi:MULTISPECIES: iron uptake porin [unclassified Thermosynechococcus]|uniref:iron uptake porin n=1 Tax=unclassified Thermosynechococcus TaxID=2622553 RepID=UPI002877CAA3|nr:MULTISPECIES: iron uptake porin [unclassified Thermosynechococcus]WNC52518.1 iron uptake porin [Thermosynechococcus sp. TG215]WNC57604.1 iron uptake porin [Thermosynechococcus sp. TG218]
MEKSLTTVMVAAIHLALLSPAAVAEPRMPAPASIGQVTSVSQLSDVRPTDWAYQALASLVEKYGCIAGYPDGTFRGNRALTRFEMAAALNACLDVISDRFATKEDLATLQRLREEFAAELATLRGRVDNLEARTATLEATQFSTTTKLSVDAVMAFQAGGNTRQVVDPISGNTFTGGSYNPTVISKVEINLNTSFRGTDLLTTTLEVGNNGLDTFGATGIGTDGLIAGGAADYSGVGANVELSRLFYSFKPTEDLTIGVGSQFYPSDIVDTNSYANDSFTDFSSNFFINNPLIVPYAVNDPGGAGVSIEWNPGGGFFTLRGVYVAAAAGAPTGIPTGGGLFGDPYQGTVELEFARAFGANERNNFAVRLQYTNSSTLNISQNAGGVNVELTLGKFGLFGRYAYSDMKLYGDGATINGLGPFTVPFLGGQVNTTAQTWMAGLAYRDLLAEGSLLAAAVGQPFINSLASQPGINDATQTNYELFFRYPLSDNISITPVFMAITNANNSATNSPIFQGLIRTTFSF